MDDNPTIVIRPVSNWTSVALEFKRAGCPNVTTFIVAMMFQCIRVPPTAIPAIYRAWKESEL